MRIWMEEHRDGDHFAARITSCILLLVLFTVAMPVGVTLLALYFGWEITSVTMTACIADVILTVWGARAIGKRVQRYCTVFCQDDQDELFAVDIQKFAGYSRGLTGYIRMLRNMQRTVRNLRERHVLEKYMRDKDSLHGLETWILAVVELKAVRSGYMADCKVRYPNGKVGRKKYLLVSGYENEEALITAFERRKCRER